MIQLWQIEFLYWLLSTLVKVDKFIYLGYKYLAVQYFNVYIFKSFCYITGSFHGFNFTKFTCHADIDDTLFIIDSSPFITVSCTCITALYKNRKKPFLLLNPSSPASIIPCYRFFKMNIQETLRRDIQYSSPGSSRQWIFNENFGGTKHRSHSNETRTPINESSKSYFHRLHSSLRNRTLAAQFFAPAYSSCREYLGVMKYRYITGGFPPSCDQCDTYTASSSSSSSWFVFFFLLSSAARAVLIPSANRRFQLSLLPLVSSLSCPPRIVCRWCIGVQTDRYYTVRGIAAGLLGGKWNAGVILATLAAFLFMLEDNDCGEFVRD